jgi:hypothetical protein
MRDLAILPQQGKGRTFRASLLASVEADLLWTGGLTVSDNVRPVWAMLAGSDQELRAFMANLTTGRKAAFEKEGRNYGRHKTDQFEILKTAGYDVTWQRELEGAVATIFLPELFQMDPGMVDPEGIRFVLLPSKEWVAGQKIEVKPLIQFVRKAGFLLPPEQLARWAPIAYLFCAYLDRRTRCPIVPDGRFYLQLFLECLKQGLSSFSVQESSYRRPDMPFGENQDLQYHEQDTDQVGLIPGLAFKASHETFEKILAAQVALFFRVTQGQH